MMLPFWILARQIFIILFRWAFCARRKNNTSGFIMKELLFKASSLGVTVRFYPITTKEYEDWVNMQGKNRYIFTYWGVVCRPSNICRYPYSCRARHEYRCHQAPYRTYPAGRMRIAYTRLHRIFRSWHFRKTVLPCKNS